jgi:hypothetical protein
MSQVIVLKEDKRNKSLKRAKSNPMAYQREPKLSGSDH